MDFYDSSDDSSDEEVAAKQSISTSAAAASRPQSSTHDSSTEDEADAAPIHVAASKGVSYGAARGAQRLPLEVLTFVFAHLIESMHETPSIWTRPVKKKDLRQLVNVARTCLSFYRALQPIFLSHVGLSLTEQCQRRLASIKSYKAFYGADHYPASCLRLRFNAFDGRVKVDKGIQMQPESLKICIEALVSSLDCVIIEIDPGGSVMQSRFFEGAETEQEHVARLSGRRLVERGIEMQTALNAFEDCAIKELQIHGTHYHPQRLIWPSDQQDEGKRLRSLRTFASNCFPVHSCLTRLYLLNIVDGWQCALLPFPALKVLRIEACGPSMGATGMPMSSRASLNQLETLEIVDPTRMPATLIFALATAHYKSLRRFALVTSAGWLDSKESAEAHARSVALLEGLQERLAIPRKDPYGLPAMPRGSHTHTRVAGAPIGDAIASLLKDTIVDLTLGGFETVSTDTFERLLAEDGACHVEALAFYACHSFTRIKFDKGRPWTAREGGAPITQEQFDAQENEDDERDITSSSLVDFIERARPILLPALRSLQAINMPRDWLWSERAADHAHHTLNRPSKNAKQRRREEERTRKSHLEDICEKNGIAFAFVHGDEGKF